MYRVYCYVNGRRLTSNPCHAYAVADHFLTAVLDMPGVSGGAVEEFIPGVGWCAHIPECDTELLAVC